MPFTPFHMGAGMLVKASAPKRFSLILFGWSQITMDLEPLYALVTGRGDLHGWTHTIWGAFIIAILTALLFRHLSFWMMRLFNRYCQRHRWPNPFYEGDTIISWRVAFLTAFIGTYSHIVLDMFMHYDCLPFRPFYNKNLLANIFTIEGQYQCMVLLGIIGLVIYLWRRRVKNRSRL